MSFIATILVDLIRFFRYPLFGPALCPFVPSCTEFACEQLQKRPLHKAFFAIGKRLLSCNPFRTLFLRK